jgi:alpha-tubulin suppressor-like RCC1 family protein
MVQLYNKNLVKIADGIKAISAGYNHTLVLKTDNSLWACGDNSDGQLGDGTTINKNTLVKIAEGIKTINAGGHTLVLKLITAYGLVDLMCMDN